nr:immunoglobulin heavy chain junction region [Macaca mulatta]MOV40678.1 immunoglobulin heavy chain junction region [Macaca mulatta]MOV40747.1 immunoglobulin heavy chain junction region [Macaca mulatta]MOV41131.1 immunoglobulin heavy chain junction region [Macaca mulatta]MOV41662.1 immunoglobulin heavy chain junction region [Macaca mulatta]
CAKEANFWTGYYLESW